MSALLYLFTVKTIVLIPIEQLQKFGEEKFSDEYAFRAKRNEMQNELYNKTEFIKMREECLKKYGEDIDYSIYELIQDSEYHDYAYFYLCNRYLSRMFKNEEVGLSNDQMEMFGGVLALVFRRYGNKYYDEMISKNVQN